MEEKWEYNAAPWYEQDTFGLKTLDESKKISFYTTDGDHLKFSTSFLLELVTKYFDGTDAVTSTDWIKYRSSSSTSSSLVLYYWCGY